jgi:hypothetical protein
MGKICRARGASTIGYESTIPAKYMIGTEQVEYIRNYTKDISTTA